MDDMDEVIRECLTTDVTTEEPPPPVIWRLIDFGDRAYEVIREMLLREQVSGGEAARAIRCLSHLVQHDLGKLLSELSLMINLAERNDKILRSMAIHSLIWGFRILKSRLARAESRGYRLQEIRDQMPTEEQVRQAVSRARARGLDAQQAELADEFLQRSPG